MTEDLERRLRRALAAEAAAVQPADGLHRIRAAIATGQHPADERSGVRRLGLVGPRLWAPFAAAAAILALAVLTPVLFRVGGPGPDDVAAVASGGPDLAQPLPVYYVSQQNGRWALVREFRPTTLTDPAARLRTAVRLAVTGDAADPDYTSAWRALQPAGAGPAASPSVDVVLGPDDVAVTLGGDVTIWNRPPSRSDTAEQARLAIDQLVWTVTATAQQVVPVAITISDTAQSTDKRLFGVLDLNRPFDRRAGPGDPRAPIWVSSLLEDERLPVGTATVSGDSAVIAGTPASSPGRWTLARPGVAGGARTIVGSGALQPVLDPAADTSTVSRQAWQISLVLPEPGRYLLSVEHDGWTDTKQVVVTAGP